MIAATTRTGTARPLRGTRLWTRWFAAAAVLGTALLLSVRRRLEDCQRAAGNRLDV